MWSIEFALHSASFSEQPYGNNPGVALLRYLGQEMFSILERIHLAGNRGNIEWDIRMLPKGIHCHMQ
jgi:hypothetical protein